MCMVNVVMIVVGIGNNVHGGVMIVVGIGINRFSGGRFFFFCVLQLYRWGSPLLGEIFAYVTVFKSNH